MANSFKVSKRDVESVTTVAFPEYNGRRFKLEISTNVMLANLHWDGGTKSVFRAVRLSDNAVAEVLTSSAPWNCKINGSYVELPEGTVIVEHAVFCGKDMGLRIYVNPNNMTKYLPTPEVKP